MSHERGKYTKGDQKCSDGVIMRLWINLCFYERARLIKLSSKDNWTDADELNPIEMSWWPCQHHRGVIVSLFIITYTRQAMSAKRFELTRKKGSFSILLLWVIDFQSRQIAAIIVHLLNDIYSWTVVHSINFMEFQQKKSLKILQKNFNMP